MQEQTPEGDATAVFATVRDRLRGADERLRDAESRAHDGGDAPSGALATSIAAVRLQVTDLLEYVDLLEWASAFCAVADDLRRAVPGLSSPESHTAVETFERSAARLGEFEAPLEAGDVHEAFVRAVAKAASELRSESGIDGSDTLAETIARLRATVHGATEGASLRTRLALEQFQACESLLGS